MATKKLKLFIGPCVLESKELAMEIAQRIKSDLAPFEEKIELAFKGSFDKANRSSFKSYRGPGLEKGLSILEAVKKETGLKLLTDFHLPEQAKEVASVVDILQVPAFLCRQTDMIYYGARACEEHQAFLKIKKGQFLSPHETKNIVDKASEAMNKERVMLTERGTSFGYNTLIVDMTSFSIMKSFGVSVIHDATHCVQQPGALGDKTGGQRQFIPLLAKSALAAGADGIFMECHPVPEKALSDASTSLPLNQVKGLVQSWLKIFEVCSES